MSKELTTEECKKLLFKLGIKLGVSPKLISERLLSDLDKDDMRSGFLTIESLECAIEVWKASGMPDYAHGLTAPMEKENSPILRKIAEGRAKWGYDN